MSDRISRNIFEIKVVDGNSNAVINKNTSAIKKNTGAKKQNSVVDEKLTNTLKKEKAAIDNVSSSLHRVHSKYKLHESQLNTLVKQKKAEEQAWAKANFGIRKYTDYLGRTRQEVVRLTTAQKLSMGMWTSAFPKLDKANKLLNTLRWSMVNVTFAMIGLAAVASPFVLLTKQGMEWEQQLKRIEVVTGTTAKSLEGLTGFFKEARSGTPFSRMEVSDSFLEFMKAGFSLEQTKTAIGDIVDLAGAGFTDLATATEIVAASMHQFALQGITTAEVVSVIAKAANESAADVSTFGNSMSYVGPIAAQLGISYKETASALTLLFNAGLSGSRAGTTLRQVLNSLSGPSTEAKAWMDNLGISLRYAADGSVNLEETLLGVKYGLDKLDPENQAKAMADMFSIRARAGAAAFKNALDGVVTSMGDITRGLDDVDYASNRAAVAFNTSFTALQDSINNLKDAMLPIATTMNEAFTWVIDKIEKATSAFGTFTEKVGGAGMLGGGAAASAVGGYMAYRKITRGSNAANPMYVYDVSLGGVGKMGFFKKAVTRITTLFGAGAAASTLAGSGATFTAGGTFAAAPMAAASTTAISSASATGAAAGTAAAAAGAAGIVATVLAGAAAVALVAGAGYMVYKAIKEGREDAEERRQNQEVGQIYITDRTIESYGGRRENGEIKFDNVDQATMFFAGTDINHAQGTMPYAEQAMYGYNPDTGVFEVTGAKITIGDGVIEDTSASGVALGQIHDDRATEASRAAQEEAEALKQKIVTANKALMSLADKYESRIESLTPISDKIFAELFEGIDGFEAVVDTFSKNMIDKLGVTDAFPVIVNFKVRVEELAETIKSTEQKIGDLKEENAELSLVIAEERHELNQLNKVLQKYKDNLSDVEDEISKLSGQRFTMETPFDAVIQKQEQVIRMQELAAYGITDVQSFIQNAIRKTGDSYEGVVDSIDKVTTAATKSQNVFKAWQQTVQEQIRSLITSSVDLATDTTQAVNANMTLLLSMSATSTQSSGKSASEHQLDLLKAAQAAYFGDMHEQVGLAIQGDEDRVNGVASGADVIIGALENEWEKRDALNVQIDAAQAKYDAQADALEKLQERHAANALAIQKETAAMQEQIGVLNAWVASQARGVDTINAANNGGVDGYRSRGGGGSVGSSYTTERGVSTTIEYQGTSPLSGKSVQISAPHESSYANVQKMLADNGYGDFIMRPGQAPIGFSEDDTVVGVKDLSSLTGGVKIGAINISGVSGDVNEFARRIAVEIRREIDSGR